MDDADDWRERDDGALRDATAALSAALTLPTVLHFRMRDLLD
jgi:hypothetical protein